MEFHLRPWNPEDLDNLVHHANDPEVACFMTDGFPHPYTPEHGKAFIEYANRDKPVHIFAIEVNGKAAGGIGIHPQTDIMRKNAELGYWLGKAYWGQGIVSKAIPQMITFAFDNYDIERLFARPYGNNPASCRVLEKAGFKLEARIEKNIYKLGEFQDELIYGFRRSWLNKDSLPSRP